MKEITEEARRRYYDEVGLRLRQAGLAVGEEKGGLLPVDWQGEPLCRLTAGGGLQYRKDQVERDGGPETLEQVIRITGETAEYMRLLEEAPALQAQDLEGDYRLLADFNGTVLAAHPTGGGVQFVTWEWDYGHTGMWQGHYYGTNYTGAKQDFTLRSGLLPQDRLFTPEELEDLYRCCQRAWELDEDLTYSDGERLDRLREHLEALSPGIGERIAAEQRQREPETQIQQTMA